MYFGGGNSDCVFFPPLVCVDCPTPRRRARGARAGAVGRSKIYSQGIHRGDANVRKALSLVDIACDHVIREKKASRRTPISCSIYMRIHRLQAFFEFYTSDVRDGEREGL